MTTWQGATEIVPEKYGPVWEPGTFMIAEVREDATHFAVAFGAREALIDGYENFVVYGAVPKRGLPGRQMACQRIREVGTAPPRDRTRRLAHQSQPRLTQCRQL